jgi:hypothetical protein
MFFGIFTSMIMLQGCATTSKPKPAPYSNTYHIPTVTPDNLPGKLVTLNVRGGESREWGFIQAGSGAANNWDRHMEDLTKQLEATHFASYLGKDIDPSSVRTFNIDVSVYGPVYNLENSQMAAGFLSAALTLGIANPKVDVTYRSKVEITVHRSDGASGLPP